MPLDFTTAYDWEPLNMKKQAALAVHHDDIQAVKLLFNDCHARPTENRWSIDGLIYGTKIKSLLSANDFSLFDVTPI